MLPAMEQEKSAAPSHAPSSPVLAFLSRLFGWYERVPLYLRILGGLVLGIIVGTAMYLNGGGHNPHVMWFAMGMDLFAKYVIQFLAALAPPLIMLAVMRALMTAKIEGRQGGYMVFLLCLNTLM